MHQLLLFLCLITGIIGMHWIIKYCSQCITYWLAYWREVQKVDKDDMFSAVGIVRQFDTYGPLVSYKMLIGLPHLYLPIEMKSRPVKRLKRRVEQILQVTSKEIDQQISYVHFNSQINEATKNKLLTALLYEYYQPMLAKIGCTILLARFETPDSD